MGWIFRNFTLPQIVSGLALGLAFYPALTGLHLAVLVLSEVTR